MISENPIDKNGPNTDASQESIQQSGSSKPEIASASTTPEVPPTLAEHYQPDRRKDSTPPWKKRSEIAAIMIAFGLLVVNIFALLAAKKAADAAMKSADTTKQQLEMSERPWVTIAINFDESPHSHSPGASLTFNSDGTASLNASVVVKNVGHSIAKFVYIRPQMYPPIFDRILTEPMDKQASWCDKVRIENPIDSQLPSLFPGEEDTENFTFGMSREDIAAAMKSDAFPKIHAIVPVIYGCVNYKSDVSKDVHQTPFLYMLKPVPVVSGTIPASKLEVFKLFKGRGAD